MQNFPHKTSSESSQLKPGGNMKTRAGSHPPEFYLSHQSSIAALTDIIHRSAAKTYTRTPRATLRKHIEDDPLLPRLLSRRWASSSALVQVGGQSDVHGGLH